MRKGCSAAAAILHLTKKIFAEISCPPTSNEGPLSLEYTSHRRILRENALTWGHLCYIIRSIQKAMNDDRISPTFLDMIPTLDKDLRLGARREIFSIYFEDQMASFARESHDIPIPDLYSLPDRLYYTDGYLIPQKGEEGRDEKERAHACFGRAL